MSYRSGSNTFHGAGWEFLRDTSLNATGFFRPATGKPSLERNQFGGVVGGPVMRNRAFFFGDYEGLRQTRRATSFSTIATPAQRQGLLSVDVRDPRSGVVYPAGSPVPMTEFARTVLAGLPDANVPGTTNNYSVLQQFTADSNKAGGKIDVQASPGLSMFGRYGFRNLTTDDEPNIPLPSGGAGNGHIYARNRQFVSGVTFVPTTTSLLEARFGYSATEAGKNPPALGSSSALESIWPPGFADRLQDLGWLTHPAHHRLLRSGAAGHQPAMAVPHRVQPEGELHLDDRRALLEGGVRASAHRH